MDVIENKKSVVIRLTVLICLVVNFLILILSFPFGFFSPRKIREKGGLKSFRLNDVIRRIRIVLSILVLIEDESGLSFIRSEKAKVTQL